MICNLIMFQAFGAPWIVVNVNHVEYCIWGSDRMPLIAALIGERFDGPIKELAAKY